MFETPQTSIPRERTRELTLADSFVDAWSNHVEPTLARGRRQILEVDSEVVGLISYEAAQIDVRRDHAGYHPLKCTIPTNDPNGIWLTELRIPKGIRVGQVRSLLRIPRLAAMEQGLEWVGCRLLGGGWPERASEARWRTDRDPTIWIFWRESFVDVSEDGVLTMVWRNPAF